MRSDGPGAHVRGLTAGVDLLPQEVDTQRKAKRRAVLSAVGVVVFIAALGGLYVHKLGQVSDAEAARGQAQTEVASLERELDQLQPYRELANLLSSRNAVLASAMSAEVSFASTLNDFALAFPASSSLESLDITLAEPEEPAGGEISFGTPVADVSYSGYSTESYAPGVETVLVEFDRVSPLFNVYLNAAAAEDRGGSEVTNFDGTAGIDESALTGRYANGLPAEETP